MGPPAPDGVLALLEGADGLPLDAFVRAAALATRAAAARIVLLDPDCRWLHAEFAVPGLDALDEHAFVAEVVAHGDVFEVPDAALDPRYASQPWVAGPPSVRFYAGVPLRLADGTCVGTLGVFDRRGGALTADQAEALRQIGAATAQVIDGRLDRARLREALVAGARADALLRHTADAVLTVDTDGRIRRWNPAASRLFDTAADDALGRERDALLPRATLGDDGATQASTVGALWHRADGTPLPVTVTRVPEYDPHGALVGFTEFIRDLREHDAAARALAASESLYRALSESSPLGVFHCDARGRCTYGNARLQALYGLDADALMGEGWQDALHADDRARVVEAWRAAVEDGREYDIEYRPAGAARVLRARGRPLLDAAGVPTGFVGTVEDVTEAREAARALAEERERLANIIESTQAGTWELNLVTGEARINAQWARMLGYEHDELAHVPSATWMERYVHPDDRAHVQAALDAHLAGASPVYEAECRLRHRAGRWIWAVCRGQVRSWTPDGGPEWMFGTHTDISVRKAQEDSLRRNLGLLNRTGEVAGVGGWELDLRTGAFAWSDETCRLHGVDPGYRPTLNESLRFYPPDARARLQAAFERAIDDGTGADLELPLHRLDGRAIWVRTVIAVECEDGRAARIVGALQDITEARRIKTELAEQHELLSVTLQSIGDAVITTDACGRVMWLNPVAERMTGWSAALARGRPLGEVFYTVSEDTRLPADNPVDACLRLGTTVSGPGRALRLIARDGAEFGIEESASPIRNAHGDVLGAVLVAHDVTEQRRLSQEMSYRATHDALTGLVNRSEFEVRLRDVLAAAQAHGGEHALLFLDLDDFKLVNDACGHAIGDQLLQQVGQLFAEAVRTRDVVARLGGDEFAVLLEHCPPEQALRIAQQICDRMDDFRFAHDGRRFRIGASVGLVPVDRRWATTAAILQAADSACYAAKGSGRNRVHVWEDSDLALRARRGEMQWATRLEQALDENRFELHAQRIEPLQGPGSGLHAEVLLRLVESDGTRVPPGAFLPAAERFHLASRIDRWVLARVIAWLRGVDDLDAIALIAVNVSGQSIGDRAFHRHAIEALRDAGPALCARLCIEITETATVTSLADAAQFIDQVRALGVRVALDDFGAGASSFGYLKALPVDRLKIDGQYIRDLIDDPLDEAAVRCFVDVAKVVGVETVAEFVDRPEVLARVRELGVHYAQGFLLASPVPLAELAPARAVAAA